MIGVGVIEGFFGPEWLWPSRHQFVKTLSNFDNSFYIYAPKRDSFLRKSWEQDHPPEMWAELQKLSSACEANKVAFGVGLSPFEIHDRWDNSAKQILKHKISKIEELNIKYLGLFFDDMRGSSDLADKQIEIVAFVQSLTHAKILFCPTYYTDDPILDNVFGQRESDYLEKIGSGISAEVEILWTGPKVISPVIEAQGLIEVAKVLRRKPFIWDNLFANDGPKQCKFLRMKSFAGRSHEAFNATSGWALNLMNQPGLSEILFSSAAQVLTRDESAHAAFENSLLEFGGTEFAELVLKYEKTLNEVGLDKMEPAELDILRLQLLQQVARQVASQSAFKGRLSQEILNWLDGQYIVGAECLTD